MKKILISLLSLVILTTQASAGNTAGLKEAFDEFNYSLSVEWDQQNQEFYNHQQEIFSEKLAELQADGLSNDDMVQFTLSQIKDKKSAQDAADIFSQLSLNQISETDARLAITDLWNKSYNQGANWNRGKITGSIIIASALILVVGIVAYRKGWDGTVKGGSKVR